MNDVCSEETDRTQVFSCHLAKIKQVDPIITHSVTKHYSKNEYERF